MLSPAAKELAIWAPPWAFEFGPLGASGSSRCPGTARSTQWHTATRNAGLFIACHPRHLAPPAIRCNTASGSVTEVM